jgi:hypothetical protein
VNRGSMDLDAGGMAQVGPSWGSVATPAPALCCVASAQSRITLR